MKPITWEPRKVKVADLKENPKNPKILNDKGKKRLHTSLGKFGLAGTLVVNKDLTIIDGHSRKKELLEAKVDEVWVSAPNRQLTQREYEEFNAIFDLATAGDPDMLMIEETLGEETLREYDLAGDTSDSKPQTLELRPYQRTHILFSFPPDKFDLVQPLIQKLKDFSFVEYEQGNN